MWFNCILFSHYGIISEINCPNQKIKLSWLKYTQTNLSDAKKAQNIIYLSSICEFYACINSINNSARLLQFICFWCKTRAHNIKNNRPDIPHMYLY